MKKGNKEERSIINDMGNRAFKVFSTTMGKAYKTGKDIVDTTKEDMALYKKIKKQNEENLKRMNESIENYSRSFIILENEAHQFDSIKRRITNSYNKIESAIEFYEKTQIANPKYKKSSGIAVSGILAGSVAAGSLAAGTVTALVASFCTAGTGAAISSLSGVYAANATLAALGGGTLATGGMGIAGGVVVASTLFAIPAVAVGGYIAHNKVQEMAKKSDKAATSVMQAINVNRELSLRNFKATETIRNAYDIGIFIDFFLQNLEIRIIYAPDNIKPLMKKIFDAARDKLVKAFLKINLFNDDLMEVANGIQEILLSIEADCQSLQSMLAVRSKDVIYSSRDITPVFQQIYEDAKQFIYMSYPWYSKKHVLNDLPLIKNAIKRGVKFVICYGIGSLDSDKGLHKTKEAIEIMKKELPSTSVRFVRSNSHRKIILCEKYVLHGSQNMMSYRYDHNSIEENDLREEATIKIANEETITEFKALIEEQIINPVF